MDYMIKDIIYDTDGEEINLPTTLIINVPENIIDEEEIDNFISDEISNVTGFCHKGYTKTLN